MGSSMGAFISLYALAEYPESSAARAACRSIGLSRDGIVIDYLVHHLPEREGTAFTLISAPRPWTPATSRISGVRMRCCAPRDGAKATTS